MATITAADVNKLRTITGAGMMDCKKALVESDGDFDLAIENLRKKGQKVAANRSDRESIEKILSIVTTAVIDGLSNRNADGDAPEMEAEATEEEVTVAEVVAEAAAEVVAEAAVESAPEVTEAPATEE